MPLETRPFDIAEMLETDEDIRHFLIDAFDTGDPVDIDLSLRTALRAKRNLDQANSEALLPAPLLKIMDDESELLTFSDVEMSLALLGLTLSAKIRSNLTAPPANRDEPETLAA